MPIPVSDTDSRTLPPGGSFERCQAPTISSAAAIVSCPPSGIASRDHREVEDRHLELVRVCLDGGQPLARVEDDLHPRSRGAGDQVCHAFDKLRQVHRGRLERLAAGEGQQPLHQRLA
jgi:hypothetical protein